VKLAVSVFVGMILVSLPASAESVNLLPALNGGAAKAYCDKQTTKRGEQDFDMYDLCMDTQLDGYDKALGLSYQYAHQPWMEQLITDIFARWTKRDRINYQMVGYNLEADIEAFLDIEYAVKNGDVTQEAVNVCEEKHLPDFNYVKYCLDL
jgi:hypothetical protein